MDSHFLQKLTSWARQHAYSTLGTFATLILVSLWGLSKGRLELDIYDVYDPSFPASIDLFEMKDAFKDRSQMLTAFTFDGSPSAEDLCLLLEWQRELLQYSEIKTVTSLWSLRRAKSSEERLLYPKLLSDPCLGKGTYHLAPELSNSFFRHLVSKHGTKDIVFDVSFFGKDADTDQVQYVIDTTESFIQKKLPAVKVKYLGHGAFRYYLKKIMLSESIYNLGVLSLIVFLMRFIYGTWISGIYLSGTLLVSNIILYGFLCLAGAPIDILTNNLFLMTAVAGTADFIFVSQAQLKESYEESFQKLCVPCFFTTLTTFLGFLSLNTSDLANIRRFGNGAALGSIAEWAVMFLLLPAILRVFKKEHIWVDRKKASSFKLIDALNALKLPRWILHGLSVLMLLSIPSFFFLNDQDSPVENLPRNHILRQGYEEFRDKFSWEGQVYLYFPEKPSPQKMEDVLSVLKRSNLIYRIENPEDLADEWTEGLPELRADLVRRELSMSPLWERYYSKDHQLRIPLYLKAQDLHTLRRLRQEVRTLCGESCRIAGQRVVYLEYGEKIARTMIESFAVSIMLVAVVLVYLAFNQGKLNFIIPVILSALMGPLVILTVIAVFQIPVTLVTSIFLAVMVGLAGDNAIQYLLAGEGSLEAGIEEKSRASIVVTLAMILGSCMFMLQSLLPIRILGFLFVLGFIINLLGDLWGLRAMLEKKSPARAV